MLPFLFSTTVLYLSSALPTDLARYPIPGFVTHNHRTFVANECFSGTECCQLAWQEYFFNKPAPDVPINARLRADAASLAPYRVIAGYASFRMDTGPGVAYFRCIDLSIELAEVIDDVWEQGAARLSHVMRAFCNLTRRVWKVLDIVMQTGDETLDPVCVSTSIDVTRSILIPAFTRRCMRFSNTSRRLTGLLYKDDMNREQILFPSHLKVHEYIGPRAIGITDPQRKYISTTVKMAPGRDYSMCDRAGEHDQVLKFSASLHGTD